MTYMDLIYIVCLYFIKGKRPVQKCAKSVSTGMCVCCFSYILSVTQGTKISALVKFLTETLMLVSEVNLTEVQFQGFLGLALL